MTLNDDERAVLVQVCRVAQLAASTGFPQEKDAHDLADAVIGLFDPIIDRLVAERDVDALLDSVGGSWLIIDPDEPDFPGRGAYRANFNVYRDGRVKNINGYGPTRTAAIAAAVAAAKENTE